MKSSTMLEILRAFLMTLGGFGVIWGIYDMFGDGQQSSMGIKKIVGGIAFAAISYFIITNNINSVNSAEAQAGISAAFYFPFLTQAVISFLG